MRVLVVGPDRNDPGGVANYYNAVFPRLADNTIEACYFEVGSTKGRGRIAHLISDQLRFFRKLNKYKPNLVHLNPSLDLKSFLRDGLFIFLAKLCRRPVLVFFRGWQTSFENQVSGRYRWFFRLTYGRADAFIVLSNAFSDSLKRWGVTVPIFIGNTTVDNDLLKSFSIKQKLNSIRNAKVFRLLFLARLERDKGVLELIDAVKSLLEKGFPVSLTIAGTGSVAEEIDKIIDNFGAYKNAIRVVGYVRGEDKVNILKSHHIYCFPTRYGEGMPNSVLEAMAFGFPIVTCPVGGVADFFENSRMGVLLSDTRPDVIADTLQAMLLDRNQLETIAQYNYRYAQRRFLATRSADFLRTRYKDMLARN